MISSTLWFRDVFNPVYFGRSRAQTVDRNANATAASGNEENDIAVE